MATKTKTKTPDKTAPEKIVGIASTKKVVAAAESLRKSREAERAARTRLDESIFAAKNAGATYRDIAAAAGVSTAWVQSALERCGYTTAGR